MEMSVADRADGITLVKLAGALDLKGTNEIDLKFQGSVAPRRQPTILDLSELTFISSLGMGMMVAAATSLRRNGKRMVLLDPKPEIAEAVRHARIDSIIPIVQGLDVAVTQVLSA